MSERIKPQAVDASHRWDDTEEVSMLKELLAEARAENRLLRQAVKMVPLLKVKAR